MINLLRADIFKLFRNKPFLVIIFICISALCLGVVSANMVKTDSVILVGSKEKVDGKLKVETDINKLKSDIIGDGTVVWLVTNIYKTADLFILTSIFAVIFVTKDFSSGIIKNIASKGISRTSIYLSKLITTFIGIFIILFIGLIAVAFFSSFVFEVGTINSNVILNSLYKIISQVFMNLGLTSMIVAISYIFRDLTINIVCTVTLVFISQLFLSFTDKHIQLMDYYIPTAMYNIDKLPINPILLSVIYILITTVIGCFAFNKQDIN